MNVLIQGISQVSKKYFLYDAENSFINVQRDKCGFMYGNEESLINFIFAISKSKTKFYIVPIWYSKKEIENKQAILENKEKEILINYKRKKKNLKNKKNLH